MTTTARKRKSTAEKPKPQKAPRMPGKAARKRRLAELLERFDKVFGEVRCPELPTVMEKAVFLVLRETGTEAAALKGLEVLRADFVDWNDVRASRPAELARMLAATSRSAPIRKLLDRARRIRGFIDHVYNDKNDTTLEFVTELSTRDRLEFLENLDDLGAHNANALHQWLSNEDHLVALAPEAAKVAHKLLVSESAAVTKARKELTEGQDKVRLVAIAAHLTQLGKLDAEGEWPASLKDLLA